MENIVVGITGASGIIYAKRLLQELSLSEYSIHVAISDAAAVIARHELEIPLNGNRQDLMNLLGHVPDNIAYYHHANIGATIASGQFPVKAMIIIPCSMNTLCSIAHGISNNLIQRAASVTLKEGRKLVLVPRETPLSSIHLEAMVKLSSAGACIMPAMPAFYHKPKTLYDLVDFVVARILDSIPMQHTLVSRWHSEEFTPDYRQFVTDKKP